MADVPGNRFHIARIGAPDLYVGSFQQVRREATEIPFGTNIGAWPQEHPHFFFLADANEGINIMVARSKIKTAFFDFMIIPENISCDGIAAHCFCHPDSMTPVFSWNSCRMHFSADDLERFAIQ